MKKEFELPNAWYLKITPDILDEINHFRQNVVKYNKSDIDYPYYNLIYEDGSGGNPPYNSHQGELSLSDFRQYVLKTSIVEPLIEKENLNYLNTFLNDIKIT